MSGLWRLIQALPEAIRLLTDLSNAGGDPVAEIQRIRQTQQRVAEMRRRVEAAMKDKA